MNQQTYNNRPQQQRQIQNNTGQCRKCGSTMNERQLTQHERGCKPPRVQQQSNQNRRQPQQQQNQQRQQQNNTQDRQQQNPFKNFQKNFEWANNPFFSQHNQQTQSDDQSDDSNQEEEEEYGNETQQPGFQYSCQDNNVSFQFSTIFGPNGVFTQSMNQMNNVMQSVNININQNGNQQNRRNQQNVYTFNTPNGQCNQYSYNNNFNQQYENDDQNDEGDDQYEQEESEEEEEQQEQEQFEEEQLGLGEDEISQMPTIQFRAGRGGNTDGSSKNCVICMNDFKYGDRLRTLRCIHRFHANCVDDWLRLKRECPICRFDQTQ